MKILVIGNRVPWPLHDGGAIAGYYLLKGLSEAGADVKFLSLNPEKHKVGKATLLEHFSWCRPEKVTVNTSVSAGGALLNLLSRKSYHVQRFTHSAFADKIADTLKKESFDAVIFDHLLSSIYLDTVLKHKQVHTLCILRQHNVEHRIWEKLSATAGNPLKKWYLRLTANRMRTFEQQQLKRFGYLFPITETDEADFLKMGYAGKSLVVPAGINPAITAPADLSEKTELHSVFHIGSMEWMPNVQGVDWLVKEVWPLVMQKFPDARLHLAGKRLNRELWQGEPGVHNHGEVPDARAFMNRYGIMAVPLFSGSGIRIKTLEAMASGKAVVSTSTGAWGLDYRKGEHLLIADTAADFAVAIVGLFADPAQAEQLAAAGRKLVEEHYDYRKIAENILRFLSENPER